MNKFSCMSYEKEILLLTATVCPRGMCFVKRTDPHIRLQDYKDALALWLSVQDVPAVVFCENSDYDMFQIEQFIKEHNTSNKPVELLSFDGNDYPKDLGKGYGEIGILSHALENSDLIGPDTIIIKVSGRLYISNFSNLIRKVRASRGIDVFCNLRRNLTWADTNIFCASVEFIREYVLPLRELTNDSTGVSFEHVLALAVHKAMADGLQWSMLPCFPAIQGISASNRVYPNSIISRVKRELFRRVKAAVLEL